MMKLLSKFFCVILVLGIITNNFVPIYASNNGKVPSFVPKISIIDNAEEPSFISGELTKESRLAPERIVSNYYDTNLVSKEKTPNNNASKRAFEVTGKFTNSKSKNVVLTIQTYEGVPIYGTERNFHIDNKGVLECVSGKATDNIEKKVKNPKSYIKVKKKDIIEAVEKHLGFTPEYVENPKPELILYPVGENYVYAYKVKVVQRTENCIDLEYYVDASNLSILNVLSNIADFQQPIEGLGIGQSGTVKYGLKILADYKNNTYYLNNTNEKIETRMRYLINGKYSWPIFSEPDSFFDSGTPDNYQAHAVDIHDNVTKVAEFFNAPPFNRNGNDDLGSTLIATIAKYNHSLNASGAENEITYMVGLGPNGKSTAAAFDVAAHEYTHGILFSEGLSYSPTGTEYGAIHEGVADVFATICEYFVPHEGVADWTMGEDLGIVFRDCANPDIDDYADYLQDPDISSHSGGGLITKAASLIAMGGTHNNQSVVAIGYGKLASIFYDAINDGYIVGDMTFMQFANATVHAATLLYGANSQEVKSTQNAFVSVGVMTPEPSNLRVVYRSGLSVKLAWDVTGQVRYGIYRRSHGILGALGQPEIFTTTTKNELTVSTLYGICDFYVAVVDAYGKRISAFSNAKTIETYLVGAPTNFRHNNSNGSSDSFSWSGTQGSTCAVYRKVAGELGEPVRIGKTQYTSFLTDSLTGSYDYYSAVVNQDGIRISPFSNKVNVGSFLPAPTSFWFTSCNGLNAGLAWWSPETGVRYGVYRKVAGSSGDPVKVAEVTNTSNNTSVTVETLRGNCIFYLAVVDPAGNRISDYSYPVYVYAY